MPPCFDFQTVKLRKDLFVKAAKIKPTDQPETKEEKSNIEGEERVNGPFLHTFFSTYTKGRITKGRAIKR